MALVLWHSSAAGQVQASSPVSHFVFGLICGTESGTPYVCRETTEIDVTGSSQCVYNHETRTCTWYGFSFDYELPGADSTLDCEWSASAPRSTGNPDAVLARDVDSGSFELTLPGRKGHFVNPQYSLRSDGSQTTDTERQACSYEGQVIFKVEYQVTNGTP